jgi:hypothetical protein
MCRVKSTEKRYAKGYVSMSPRDRLECSPRKVESPESTILKKTVREKGSPQKSTVVKE